MPGQYLARNWHHQPHLDAPPRYRKACRYKAFVPDALGDLKVHFSGEAAGLVAESERAIRELNDAALPALAPLAHLLLRTEAIASSRVEGLQLGVRELARAEARMEAGGRRSQTAAEIIDNVRAMEIAVSEAALAPEFGAEQLQLIHWHLMQNSLYAGIAGEFRTSQNWIGGNDYNPCGADFVPPPIEELPRLLTDLYQAVNEEILPTLMQAALVHAQFETIHPFNDGNGRTGRALIHVVLKKRGVTPNYVPPVSVILAANRGKYINGLTSFRGDAVGDWIEQFASAAYQAARLAQHYLDEVRQLKREWTDKVESTSVAPRADATVWLVLEALPGHPVMTARQALRATGRSRKAVYEALGQLEHAGVLIPLGNSRRNQAWEAAGLLKLVGRLEAGVQ
jgi:Fic family protein